MGHTKATVDVVLTLEVHELSVLKWHIDASFAVHPDMRGHTGGGSMSGKCSVFNESERQKINGKRSVEMDVIGVDDIMPQVTWKKCFMEAQGHSACTMIHQDNKSATLSETNG